MRRARRRTEQVTAMAIVAVSPEPFAQIIIVLHTLFIGWKNACGNMGMDISLTAPTVGYSKSTAMQC